MATIVLADDHTMVRQGIREVLDKHPELTVVGEADNGLAAIELTKQLHPDVLIVDLMMPGLSGIEVTRQVSDNFPDTKTILLSMYGDEAHVRRALVNGACGYLLKEATITELVDAVQHVLNGDKYFSSALSKRIIESYIQNAQDIPAEPYDELTNREREVFQMLIEGYSSTEIGKQFFISPRTVDVHRVKIMRKLGVHSVPELIRYAIRHGLLPPEG